MKQPRHPDLSSLLAELPPFVSRNHPRFKELTGFSGRSLATMDSLGQGPKGRILLGKCVAYPREALVAWLEERSRFIKSGADRSGRSET